MSPFLFKKTFKKLTDFHNYR